MNELDEYEKYCLEVKEKYRRLMKSNDFVREQDIELKKCLVCRKWDGKKRQCAFCEGVYHIGCDNFKIYCTHCFNKYNEHLSKTPIPSNDNDDYLDDEFMIPLRLIENDMVREQSRINLENILKMKNIQFTDELLYLPGLEALNNPKNSLYHYKLNDYNIQQYYKLKKYTNQGYFLGLEIFVSPGKGFGVRTTQLIKQYTLLGEYTGKVYTKEMTMLDINNVYLFDLLTSSSFTESLTVDAQDCRNLLAFMNGNNTEPNCKSVIVEIDGKLKILIYTIANIACGEEISFDYGEDDLMETG